MAEIRAGDPDRVWFRCFSCGSGMPVAYGQITVGCDECGWKGSWQMLLVADMIHLTNEVKQLRARLEGESEGAVGAEAETVDPETAFREYIEFRYGDRKQLTDLEIGELTGHPLVSLIPEDRLEEILQEHVDGGGQ